MLDSFALPDGQKGARTRAWFGLADQPLFAWAGFWRDVKGRGPSYNGLITTPNALVGEIADHMPAIVKPADYQRWLSGSVIDGMDFRRSHPAEDMYVERNDER